MALMAKIVLLFWLAISLANMVQARWFERALLQDTISNPPMSPPSTPLMDVIHDATGPTVPSLLLKDTTTPVNLTFPTTYTNITTNISNSTTSNPSHLHRRQCIWNEHTLQWYCDFRLPTMYELVSHYQDGQDAGRATRESSVWFYTNLPMQPAEERAQTFLNILGYLMRSGIDAYSVIDGTNRFWLRTQRNHITSHLAEYWAANAVLRPGEDAGNVFDWCYYQAAAAATLNPDAYLFTRSDQAWRWNSVWQWIEYPQLARNPDVQRIWRIDPRPESPNFCESRLLWSRERRDPLPPMPWVCPV
ncbi:hypothetical protein HRR83_000438 [Exophiala dermatitidis]|uniref:Uncharacterized protein n=1 Tax=Exophiala dermatitidis TaxID=5970 RepID=A0AAN6F534_EXODE|nr:hypothetical protein HRR75_000398 [Exophiala dermatitidis]KAJ4527685.1 hypothetical protein HRR74_000440 [Exophiala dermatitidis]KAJ4528321.1 hypothetical protein HRR73_000944 [Exophiala dermatitidis]KAJ4531269.1 hypothetical protein HRR76_008937 [Exophiala dermatitidis]KAJ4538998.1 hypothetical protein HRR78_007923 [Exophiala dermatitidis]